MYAIFFILYFKLIRTIGKKSKTLIFWALAKTLVWVFDLDHYVRRAFHLFYKL